MKKKAIEDLYPLTPMQQGMLFHSLVEPHSGVYFEQVSCTLRGDLDVAAFERAWQRVVERHPVLRTGFQWQQRDEPFQVVYRRVKLPLEQLDWQQLAPTEQAEQLAVYQQADRQRGFEFSRAPLMRLALIRLAGQAWQLIWSYHHLLLDGWSGPLLLKEVFAFYQAFSQGQELSLAYPRSYSDYIGWLQQQDSSVAEAFWRRMLKGLTAPTSLPIDQAPGRGAGQQPLNGEDAQHEVQIPAAVTAALQSLARQNQLTVNTLVQGAWALLLSRYSGEAEVVFGATVSGRPPDVPGIEAMIGLFINTLPVRVRVEPGATLVPWLRELQAQQLELRQYEYSALVQVQGWSDVPRGLPLFESLVVFENYPLGDSLSDQSGNLRIEDVRVVERTNYPITLAAAVAGATLALKLSYARQRFDSGGMQRLLGHLQALLTTMAANPTAVLATLPLLTDSEHRQLVQEWNATQAPYPHDQCLHQLVEAQVARTPDAVAVSFAHANLTYQELDRRANRLAHYLQRMQVGPEVQVGVCMERSLEMIVALLGVLKAGGAYVPLDPHYPAERLAFMLEDARVSVLLTNKEIGDWRLEISQPRQSPISNLQSPFVIDLEADWERIALEPSTAPDSGVGPDNLAYMIYTSGSTGQPKGAMVPHRGVCNLLTHRQRVYQLTARDRVLQTCSFSFDPSVWGMFWPLVVGARLLVIRPDGQRDSDYLIETLVAQQATVYDTTGPAILQVLVEEPRFAACTALRHVFTGGEVLPGDLQERFFRRVTAALHNSYGPTEATVDATAWTCRPENVRSPAPIGRPIANVQIYLLDRHMQPVPIGVPGELYIGGAGVTRGYANRPDLTAERFVPNPFAQERLEIGDWRLSGAQSPISNLQSPISNRLYKTGDLARYLPDGLLEFMGRVDQQVKLRGFRIELGEIEAVLCRHPGVREAAVAIREDVPGHKRLVAYVVSGDWRLEIGDSASDNLQSPISNLQQELRALVRAQLPEYMVPAAFVTLEALPLSPNGKTDRQALPAPDTQRPTLETTYQAPQSALERRIAEVWQAVLQIDHVGRDDNFFDLGGHSLLLVQLHQRLRSALDRDLALVDLFQYPTVGALAQALSHTPEPDPITPAVPPATEAGPTDIAIIGMAGRFPGAATLDQFWHNLAGGVEALTHFSDEQLAAAGVPPALRQHPHYVPARPMLDDVELFDAAFFGLTPREAELLDPQQRLFLECSYQALERAGYDPSSAGSVGVFAGLSFNSYLWHLASDPALRDSADLAQLGLGSDKDFLATRVSYKLNLSGPSLTVQTACSTSLVAVHLACQSLRNHECKMALAGGVSITVPQTAGYLYQEGGIKSPDGHCRAFDAAAQGTVVGSGVGVVVLKPLAAALADSDPIAAVIRGSAINNDGAAKVGYTAPSVDGQAQVIRQALAQAGLEPHALSYVEAHGTATPLGDPIELAALTQAFGANGASSGWCGLGSVKTNIGHLDAAAGIAGLIKTTLALMNEQLPPSLHFESANPQLGLERSPFAVVQQLMPWPRQPERPRRAGVSSFGIGGTNAHVIVEEAPQREPGSQGRPWQLLLLSARSPAALEQATGNLAAWLAAPSPPQPLAHAGERGGGNSPDLADVAYTLQLGRHAFAERRVVVCRERAEALAALSGGEGRVLSGRASGRRREVALLLSGQGTQYAGMGRELYQVEPVYRAALEQCIELAAAQGVELRAALETGDGLEQTALGQPALFALEYALAAQWRAWGVAGQALLGHSLGEYVAACLAGVFTLEEGMRLVCARGRLMQALPPGAMLAVPLSEQELLPLLGDALDLAAVNGPAVCVVSGPPDPIDALQAALAGRGVECRRLRTTRAFHSRMVEPILAPFAALLKSVALQPPRIPMLSNVSGAWLTAAQATDPHYWLAHLRQPVRFADGLAELLKEPDRVLLEVGPGHTLSSFARRHPARTVGQEVVASLPGPADQTSEMAFILSSLGKCWLAGVKIDWSGVHSGERRQRVVLPTYPFERQRYWIESKQSPQHRSGRQNVLQRNDIADWLYVPSWKRVDIGSAPDHVLNQRLSWLVFCDECGLGDQLTARLQQAGHEVRTVRPGQRFARVADHEYSLNPGDHLGYAALLDELRAEEKLPARIIHLWSVTANTPPDQGQAIDNLLERGFYSLLFLVQALERHATSEPLHIKVISTHVQQVTGEELLYAEKAPAMGLCKVIPQEYPHISCQTIDLVAPAHGWSPRLIDKLIVECAAPSPDVVVAYRGERRWTQVFEPVRRDGPLEAPLRLREEGVYLITGGLGRIGLLFAEYLARTVRARLILVGRSTIPQRDQWERWLETHPTLDSTSSKIQRVQALEQLGAEVLVISADVADPNDMHAVVRRAEERFGALHGVIHSAGLVGGAAIKALQETGRAECELHFGPKVRGLLVLAQVLRDQPLDFCLLQSSLAAILGGLGFGAYSAANSFMDAFVHQRNQTSAFPWISINWDGWQFNQRSEAPAREPAPATLAISAAEGVEIFRRIFALGETAQVIVSTADLQAKISQWITQPAPADTEQTPADSPSQRYARPNLANPYIAPRNALEQSLAGIWQELLGIDQVGINDSFLDLGGDSLLSIQVLARVKQLGLSLTLAQLVECQTIAELAAVIDSAPAAQAEQELEVGALPLMPGHQRLFSQHPALPDQWNRAEKQVIIEEVPLTPSQLRFFQFNHPDPQHYNVASLLEIARPLEPVYLEQALRHLLSHHAGLRQVFYDENGAWQSFIIAPPVSIPFRYVDISSLGEAERGSSIEETATQLQQSFKLSEGPLVRVALFNCGTEQSQRLLTIFHHLITDAVSMGIWMEDLRTSYQQISRGEPIRLLSHVTSSKDWVERLVQHTRSGALQHEVPYWLSEARRQVALLPVDYTDGIDKNTEGSACIVRTSLDADHTRTLLKAIRELKHDDIQPLDVLLTALVEACGRWTGSRQLLVQMTNHGRAPLFPDVDVSRTIGFTVSYYPVLFDLAGCDTPLQAVRTIRRQLRDVPDHGIGYGLLRYLSDDTAIRTQLHNMPEPEVFLNYLGHQGRAENTWARPAREMYGPTHTPQQSRLRLLRCQALIADNQLLVHWIYSANIHKETTIAALAQYFMEELQRIIHDLPASAAGVDDQAAVSGPAPLTPPQLWFLEDSGLPHHQFYEPIIFQVAPDLDPERLREALRLVVEHHDHLRARFRHEAGGWQQFVAPPGGESPFLSFDLSGLPATEHRNQVEQIGRLLQGSPNLAEGPLRLVYFRLGADRPGRLLLLIHHLVMDDVSLALVFEDLTAAYQQLGQGQAVRLPPKTTSFKRWGERLAAYAQSPAMEREFDYWRGLPWERLAPLPTDVPRDRPRAAFSSMRSSFVELSVEETGALLRAARFDSAAQIHEVLLAALAYALAHWSGHDTVQVMVLGHARYPVFDGIDLARTVGWLTIGTPMVLSVARDQCFAEVIQSIKTQCRQVPLRGLGHGVLERLSPYAAQAAALRAPYPVEVEFNYAGQSSSAQPASSLLRGHADEQVWQTEGLLVEPSSSLLGWKGTLRDGRLIMKCSYNEELLQHDTFERIMHHFNAALASLGTRK